MRFDVNDVIAQVRTLFEAVNVPPGNADDVAQLLVESECRGITTHGVSRVPSYLRLLETGRVTARPEIRIIKASATVTHVYGDNGLGQVVGLQAVRLAEITARQEGVSFCLIGDCGHMGELGAYVRRLVDHGLWAWLAQATVPSMAPAGARGPAIGNNPLAFGVPIPHRTPLVFDMSCSVAARGNVLLAAQSGASIPGDWAVDRFGRPTTSAVDALEGSMLPVGGHKGVGLAMMIQCLAGVLSGVPLVPRLSSEGALPHAGAFLLVIDAARWVGDDHILDERTTQWVSTYEALAGPAARLPGHRAANAEAQARMDGLDLSAGTLNMFRNLCTRYDVPYGLHPVTHGTD